jgi:hypothetical protein
MDMGVKGYDRTRISCGDGQGLLLAVGGVGKTGEGVLLGEVGKVREHFGVGYAGDDIVDGDAHASDAEFTAAFAGFEDDDVLVVHGWLKVGKSLSN